MKDVAGAMAASRESQESDYHTYEAIGKGKFSTVYKARKKRSIQYYAMKSVEKSQRARIMHEVQVVRALSHENILKIRFILSDVGAFLVNLGVLRRW